MPDDYAGFVCIMGAKFQVFKQVTLIRRESKCSKYPNDVALSEAMLIERDQPLTIRALKAGQKNEDVLAMKLRLQELGYFDADAKIDNQFNNATVNRVKGFQRVNGITATGEADIYTLALMFSGLAVGK